MRIKKTDRDVLDVVLRREDTPLEGPFDHLNLILLDSKFDSTLADLDSSRVESDEILETSLGLSEGASRQPRDDPSSGPGEHSSSEPLEKIKMTSLNRHLREVAEKSYRCPHPNRERFFVYRKLLLRHLASHYRR